MTMLLLLAVSLLGTVTCQVSKGNGDTFLKVVFTSQTCETGWSVQGLRASGFWCVKVFLGTYTQPQAQAQCEAVGATLSGIQSANDAQVFQCRFLTNESLLIFITTRQ